MLRIVLTLVVVGCFAAACTSGGGSDKGGEPTVVSEDVFRWSAQQAVNAVLLTENDLPANFDLTVDEGEEDDDEALNFNLTGDCARFNEYMTIETDWLHSVAEGSTGDFENENEDGFSSSSAAFRDADAAETETEAMREFFATCSDQYEAGFVAYFNDPANTSEATFENVTADVQEIAVPEQGDWSHGLRVDVSLVVNGVPIRFITDSITVRTGQMVAVIEYSYSDAPDEALRDGTVATVAARLAAEEEKLPS